MRRLKGGKKVWGIFWIWGMEMRKKKMKRKRKEENEGSNGKPWEWLVHCECGDGGECSSH